MIGVVSLTFILEQVKEKDLEKCIDAILSSIGNRLLPVQKNRENLRRLLFGEYVITIVAKTDNRIAGLISGTCLMPPEIGLLTVMAKKNARKGLHDMLIDKFMEALKKRLPKAPYVMTRLRTDQTDAISLYSSKGFRIEGFLKNGLMGQDVVFLRKSLKK